MNDRDMVNLFDFFGGTETLTKRLFTLADLHVKPNLQVLVNDQDEHGYMVRNAERILQRIKMRAPEYKEIETVWTFDRLGKLVKSEYWDTRGFKALEQWHDATGAVTAEQAFNPAGKVYYQTFHTKDPQGKVVNSLYRILNWNGTDYSFNGEQSMMRFFLDELNKRTGENNVFVVDRTFELAWSVLNMKTRAFKMMHLHSNHLNDPEQVMTATLNYNYEYAIKNLDQWQGIAAPTPQQRADVIERWGSKVPVFELPVGIVSDDVLNAPHVPWQRRTPGKIIMVARLSPEKQQDKVIAAFEQVHKAVPAARLEFWGYANGKEGDRLNKIVADKQLGDLVTFHDYTLDVGKVYDDAQINVLASRAEGFSLALLEAQSHGVPTVSYDAKYGPQGIIADGRDGYLVKLDDVDAFAAAITKLLKDDQLMQQFSEHAYDDAQRFSEDAVWEKWCVVQNAVADFVTTDKHIQEAAQ
ncbi:glycosyltransferase [Furfurilactobacillus siliginis]|uniref:glycosyltransferase n=1 Tax=Furfurilactobacillus siliginis TaxID=348151 RepID=UPI001ED9A2FC|nr:glycosyltransferase [Furfurilactobacillus siliginis]